MRYRLNELRQLIKEAVVNAYEVLGVPRFTASDEEIRQAYRKKAIAMHPDRNRDRDTTSDMVKINVARDVLLDKTPDPRTGQTRRQKLDNELRYYSSKASHPVDKQTYKDANDEEWRQHVYDQQRQQRREREDMERARQERMKRNREERRTGRDDEGSTTPKIDRHFTFVGGKSSKFWSVKLFPTGNHPSFSGHMDPGKFTVTVRFGRIGSDGRLDLKNFMTYSAASKFVNDKIREKLNKGYQEVTKRPQDAPASNVGGKPNAASKGKTSSTSNKSGHTNSAAENALRDAAKAQGWNGVGDWKEWSHEQDRKVRDGARSGRGPVPSGTSRKVYGKKGKFDVHTRIDGTVFGRQDSKFKPNDKATFRTNDGKTKAWATDPSDPNGTTQEWEKE